MPIRARRALSLHDAVAAGGFFEAMGGQRAMRVISVGGGKGGVGKSIVAANLGLAIAQTGARAVVVDADLGAANQHILFGIDKPRATLQSLLDKTVDSLAEVIVPTSAPGVWLVPGSIGVVGAANIAFQQKAKLIRHIRALEADAVIIDVGAGVSFNVLDLFDMADVRLVVMTPQLTALQNAYAFLKGAVFRELRRLADTEERSRLIDASPEASTATRRVPELVGRVREIDAGFGARLLAGLAGFGACILGNQLFDASERNTLDAVARMMNDFLGIDAPVIGALRASRRIHDSVQARRPYLLDASSDESSAAFREIARYLLQQDVGALRRARESLDPREVPAGETHDEPLPAPFTSYFRAHERFPVSCRGTLIFASGSLPVEILDVSTGGAKLGLEKPAPPIGSRALLILGCLPERPSVPCVIRNAPDRSAGVQFLAEPRITERIALEIVRGFATTTGATSPDPQGPAPLPGIRG